MGEEASYNIELMQLRLAKLLYDYSIKRKTVDENYIYKVIDIVIAGRGLIKYVARYEVVKELEQSQMDQNENVACYNYDDKLITLSQNGIKSLIEQSKQAFLGFFPSNLEQHLFINLVITQVILHELEHANQQKIVQTTNDMEAKILRLRGIINVRSINELRKIGKISEEETEKLIDLKIQEFAKKRAGLYLYAPRERLAEIRSYQQVKNILQQLPVKVDSLNAFAHVFEEESMLRGYDVLSPTIYYLTELGEHRELRKFDWYDEDPDKALQKSKENYSLEKRLIYGLPTTEDERTNYKMS